MKKRLNILLLSLLLLVAGTFSVSAQMVDVEGQYVDTVFNDHVDRPYPNGRIMDNNRDKAIYS